MAFTTHLGGIIGTTYNSLDGTNNFLESITPRTMGAYDTATVTLKNGYVFNGTYIYIDLYEDTTHRSSDHSLYIDGISPTKGSNSVVIQSSGSGFRTTSGNVYLFVPSKGVEKSQETYLTVTATHNNATIENDLTTIEAGKEITITAKANDGYRFKRVPTYKEGTTTKNFTLSTDTTTATLTVTPNSDFTITANAGKIDYYEFTNNVKNTTVTGTEKAVVGLPLNIVLTPAEGYEFDGIPRLQNANGSYPMTVQENGTAIYSSTISDDDYNLVTISGKTKEKISYLTVTNNLKNATIASDITQLVAGVETTILVNSNTGYGFKTAPTITMGTTTENFTIGEDAESASITFTPTANFSIDGGANEYYNITVRGTGSETPQMTVKGIEKVFVGDTLDITLTPNTGYSFSNVPFINSYGTSYNFTVATDGTAHFSGVFDEDENLLTIYADTKEDKPTPTPSTAGFIRIFTPTEKVLDLLSNYGLVNPTTGGSIDLSRYIYGLYRVFVSVPNDGKSNIFLSRNDTNIQSDYTNDSIITIEGEEITLPKKYGNVYDYSPFTTCQLYLPFIGTVDFNVDILHIGAIKLAYRVNLLNMDTMAIIYIDGKEYGHYMGKCGYNIPFNLGQYSYNVSDFAENGYLYDLDPKIILTHSKPYDNGEDKAGKEITEYVETMGTLKGLNTVEVVKWGENNQITDSEKSELERLLNSGVYF